MKFFKNLFKPTKEERQVRFEAITFDGNELIGNCTVQMFPDTNKDDIELKLLLILSVDKEIHVQKVRITSMSEPL